MAKRFTDTDKWKKPFIRGLEAPYKLLWLYILDDCDHSGMWQVDIEVAEIRLGETLTIEKAKEFFAEKIQIFDDGEKWFIPDFIEFQYGKLNEENRAHKSVINLLSKYENKGLTSSLQGAKDKEKDKDMVKVKDKVKDKEREIIEIIYPFNSQTFMDLWSVWKKFKQEQFRFTYKSIGEQGALKELSELSGGSEDIAIKIIHQSINKSWKGFFKLQTNGKQQLTDTGLANAWAEDIAKNSSKRT